jgi:hypothetical protein
VYTLIAVFLLCSRDEMEAASQLKKRRMKNTSFFHIFVTCQRFQIDSLFKQKNKAFRTRKSLPNATRRTRGMIEQQGVGMEQREYITHGSII